VLAALAILWPELVASTFHVRLLALLATFIGVPVVVLALAYLARAFGVAVLRVLRYTHITERLDATSRELDDTRRMVTTLAREQNELRRFEIDRVLRYGDDTYITLAFALVPLERGDRIAVLDTSDGLVLGQFVVTN
jgi:phosphopantothenate synthetase